MDTVKKVWSVYTSASMVLLQNGRQKAKNPTGINAGHRKDSEDSLPARTLRNDTEAAYNTSRARQAIRLENKLTLKGIDPIGKKVTALAIRL